MGAGSVDRGVPIEQRDHDVVTLRHGLLPNHDKITVADAGVDHAVALDLQREAATLPASAEEIHYWISLRRSCHPACSGVMKRRRVSVAVFRAWHGRQIGCQFEASRDRSGACLTGTM